MFAVWATPISTLITFACTRISSDILFHTQLFRRCVYVHVRSLYCSTKANPEKRIFFLLKWFFRILIIFFLFLKLHIELQMRWYGIYSHTKKKKKKQQCFTNRTKNFNCKISFSLSLTLSVRVRVQYKRNGISMVLLLMLYHYIIASFVCSFSLFLLLLLLLLLFSCEVFNVIGIILYHFTYSRMEIMLPTQHTLAVCVYGYKIFAI